jgi:hypothetical protein
LAVLRYSADVEADFPGFFEEDSDLGFEAVTESVQEEQEVQGSLLLHFLAQLELLQLVQALFLAFQ